MGLCLNMIKYAILNPANGTYTFATTEAEREELLRKFAMEFYLSHVHGVPYSIVEVAEDGSEQWRAPAAGE